MERKWIYAAGLCMIAAAIFLLRSNLDAAFVTATLGVIAWFLNYRNQLKRTLISAEDEDEIESNDSGAVDEN